MKRFILLTTVLLLVLSINSTPRWQKEYHPVDELLEIPAYTEYSFENDDVFIVISADLSDSEANIVMGFYTHHFKELEDKLYILAGFYAPNGNLISKKNIQVTVSNSNTNIISCFDKEIKDYLLNKNGYIRLVSFETREGSLDIKIPCFN